MGSGRSPGTSTGIKSSDDMPRKANDGRGRLGGRKKGTPNKSTSDLKQWLSGVLNDNRNQFEKDLKTLLPEDRIRLLSGLFNYVIPKQQSLSIEEQIQNETESLSRWLEQAPEEAIEAISRRVIELQKLNSQDDETER